MTLSTIASGFWHGEEKEDLDIHNKILKRGPYIRIGTKHKLWHNINKRSTLIEKCSPMLHKINIIKQINAHQYFIK